MTSERVEDKEQKFKIDGLVRNNYVNDGGDDSKGGKGIMGNKMLIWHCVWFGLAAVCLVVSIVCASMKSLGDNALNLIKFVVIPGLVVPTITEMILLIFNKSDEDDNKDEEEDDGYVKPDFFSGRQFCLIIVAEAILPPIIGIATVYSGKSEQKKYPILAIFFIFISIGNMILSAYSEIKRRRVPRWVKWGFYPSMWVKFILAFIIVVNFLVFIIGCISVIIEAQSTGETFGQVLKRYKEKHR